MTKTIRIENADTSTYKVRVTTEEKVWEPDNQKLSDHWVQTKVATLDYPTHMFTDCLTSTKRFIIEENI